jgi:hypothetical protein
MIDLIGGPDRDRTDDLFHAMEARSQLRHRPTIAVGTTFLFSPFRRRSVKPASVLRMVDLPAFLPFRSQSTQGRHENVSRTS